MTQDLTEPQAQPKSGPAVLAYALLKHEGRMIVSFDRRTLTANANGEWCVFTTFSEPTMLHRGGDLGAAVRVLEGGK